MEPNIVETTRRISEVTLADHKMEGNDVSNHGDVSYMEQDKFNHLITKAKKCVGEGHIEDALKYNKRALKICYSEKLDRKVKKMEDYIASQADDSDDDNGMVHMGKGFHLYKDLYQKLYAHQQEGVLWLWSLFRRKKGGILGDDMGLGKTIQVIGFLSGMFDMQKIHSVLIVLPVAVMVNWEKEFNKWAPGLKVVAFHGSSKREKERALARVQRRGGICLTTYGLVVTSWEQLGHQDGREFIWDYMILDEGHKIKNPTKTSKGVHAIPAHNRILLTGTPVQNNLKELWALFDFVHQGSLLGTQRTFKMEYDNPITRAREKDATVGEKKLGLEMAESLKKIISPYFLRRTKAEVKKNENKENDDPQRGLKHAVMPTMTRKNDLIVWTFLTETQLKIYSDFLSLDSVKELLMTSKSPLVALNVLKKICDHPRLLSTRACAQLGIEGDEGLDDELLETEAGDLSAVTRIQHVADNVLINESGKLIFLAQLVDRIKMEGHRCLVFSQSRKMLDIMQKIFTNRGHKVMRLDGTIASVQERENRIMKFQTDNSYSVFLLTTQVGGVGLTLTAADRVIIYDPSWNPATDAQAVDRVFRIGQDKNVIIYRLITCGTVEEKIYRRQIFKDSITRQTTGNTKNPHRYFSKSELRELFTMDDPRSSTTQQQLEQMHSGHRLTDPSLDEHIAYLYSLEMFGLSDHDLMFSSESGDDQDVDDDQCPENDYIQHRVEKARELIQMESSQSATLEERLGKAPGQVGAPGVGQRGQFSKWDFPKPELQEEQDEDNSRDSDVDDAIDLTTQSPMVTVRPEPIDLTTPDIKPDIKREIDLTTTPRVKREPAFDRSIDEYTGTTPSRNNRSLDSDVKDENHGNTSIDVDFNTTHTRSPLREMNLSMGEHVESPFKIPNTTPKVQGNGIRSKPSTPRTPKHDNSVVMEELIISPDSSNPIVDTKRHQRNENTFLSTSNLSSLNFKPNLNSTIFGSVDSPDIIDQSLSKVSNSSTSSSPGKLGETPDNKPHTSGRFKVIVEDSPNNSTVSNNHSNKSSNHSNTNSTHSAHYESEGMEQDLLEDSVIIEDSMIETDDGSGDGGNISVQDIRSILEKSLHHSASDAVNSPVKMTTESPMPVKSRRKSTAFHRRITDSFDDEEDDSNNEFEVSDLHADDNEDSEEGLCNINNDSADDMEGVEQASDDADQSDSHHDQVEAYHHPTDTSMEAHGDINGSVTREGTMNGAMDDKEVLEEDVAGGKEEAEDDFEGSEEESEEEDDLPEFSNLPEEDQIRYNELVESGRYYCQLKQYAEGQAHVLQALEIYPDPELQATAMTIQRKIIKQQLRSQMEQS